MKLDQMADILLAPAPETPIPLWLFFAAMSVALLILFFLLFLFWKLFKQPLLKLEHDLKQDKVQTREAAHCLARLLDKNKNTKISRQIDQLRFQRQPPDINTLLSVIDTLKHEH